jgi:hypothetical protein
MICGSLEVSLLILLSAAQSLHNLLQNEQWKDAAKSLPMESIDLQSAISRSPLYTPRLEEEGSVSSFEQWVIRGNPFTKASGKTDALKRHWKQVCGGEKRSKRHLDCR